MELPVFKYHPDPVLTGSIAARDVRCVCCGEARNHVYVGPMFAKSDLDKLICPWCISSGLAHQKLGAEFNDKVSFGDDDFTRKALAEEIKDEVAYRTPGFSGWQKERWLVHCGDACTFLGPAGKEGVEAFKSTELLDSLRTDVEMNEEQFQQYLNDMDREYGPTAYVFQCLHCGLYLGYSDVA